MKVIHEKPPVRTTKRRSKTQMTRLLLEVSNELAASRTLSDALSTLVRLITSEIGAERGSIFLNDFRTSELYTRVGEGKFDREIRMLNHIGIAGHVFTSGQGQIINDPYSDPRFNRAVDGITGYVTRSITCAPLRTLRGEIIGVAQLLNKMDGPFTEADLQLLEAMIRQAAVALEGHRTVENVERSRTQELEMLKVVSEVSTELKLGPLLRMLIGTITRMLDAERSTLFINDEKTGELYTEVGEGLGATQIRLPNHAGIAGAAFQSRETINIPYAYADLRFNPSFDRKTGFFTRSILCVPVINKNGKAIGVTQVLNKRGGAFSTEDEARLKAFTSQISIGLENAKLFDDVQNMKNYNDSILESMSSGVITLNEEETIVTCNDAGLRLTGLRLDGIVLKPAKSVFSGANEWIMDKVRSTAETQSAEITMDAELEFESRRMSANVNVMPLISTSRKRLGTMIMIEDITREKRMKATMSRYMDASIADKLLQGGQDILGGQSSMATVLFSDIRSFTTVTEELGPQATVSLLNEYFTIMVDCIQHEEGMLDKFIGDAIMAVFGVPLSHGDDEDRAVRAAISMLTELEHYNARRIDEGKRPIQIGIGINTDTVVSGNIGSPKRMDYTVIGDGVNLASRLEGACKQYGVRLIVSESTALRLKGTYRRREIDRVVVKGKTQPVSIYEFVDHYNETTFPHLVEVLARFRDGIEYYRKQSWDRAQGCFEAALALNPSDTVSSLYIERCAHLREHDPGPDWDGVWVMKSK